MFHPVIIAQCLDFDSYYKKRYREELKKLVSVKHLSFASCLMAATLSERVKIMARKEYSFKSQASK